MLAGSARCDGSCIAVCKILEIDIPKPGNIFSVLVGIIDLNDNILWFWIF